MANEAALVLKAAVSHAGRSDILKQRGDDATQGGTVQVSEGRAGGGCLF
jgi:hypothetical protein